MPTTRGAALLVGAVLLWLAGRFLGIGELHVVAVAAAGVVAAGAFLVFVSATSIAVRRAVAEPRIRADGSTDVVLELRNDTRFPAGLLLVSDEVPYRLAYQPRPGVSGAVPGRFVVPGLSRGGRVALRYRLVGAARGRYRLGPVVVRLRDPFGTTERTRRFGAIDEVLVYPRIAPLAEGAARGAHRGAGASDARRLLSSGDEFYTMREYVQGDDLRRVHWPSTAHRDTLMVRQQEQPWQAQATVFCDLRATVHRGSGVDSTFEQAVHAAASVVWHLADRDYELRLVADDDVAAARPQPWQLLLERLAEAAPSDTTTLVGPLQRLRTSGGGGLLVAVVAPPPAPRRGAAEPLGANPEVQALLQAGRAFDGRIALVLAPIGGDPRADALAALLGAAGWRATTTAPRAPLADAWQQLVRAGTRRGVPAGTTTSTPASTPPATWGPDR